MASATSADEELRGLLEELRHRCPVVCPEIVPAGHDDRADGAALLAFCRDDDERRAAVSVLKRARRGARACALTGEELAPECLQCVAQWELHPDTRTRTLRRCIWVSSEAATLLDPLAVLEVLAAGRSSEAEATAMAQLFCAVNLHDDRTASPSDARRWLQECYGLAYACRVLAGALGRFQSLGPDGEPIGAPVARVLEAALAPSAAQPTRVDAPQAPTKRPGSGAGRRKRTRESRRDS